MHNEHRKKEEREKPVSEFIDPVVTKTSPKRSFSVIENERYGLVFAKTGSVNSGIGGGRGGRRRSLIIRRLESLILY
jgi:hypothetical protein